MAATAAGPSPATQARPGVPSRNPLPLSASQEAQVREIYYSRVRSQCAEEIKAFATCCAGRTFSVAFACRTSHRAMNGCMTQHATQEQQDTAREEWFALRLERQRAREQKAQVAAAQEDFMREWWGLPEDVRLSRQREMERQRGERVGGMPARDRPRRTEGSR